MRTLVRVLICGLCLAAAHWALAYNPLPSGEREPVVEHAPDFAQRMAAIEMLGRRRDHAAAPELIKALADKDPDIRAQAAVALGRVRAAEGVLPLVQALRDTTPAVRMKAAQALSMCSGEALQPATEIIGKTFQEDGNGLDESLAAALVKIRTARAATLLFTTLANRHDGNVMNSVVQYYQVNAPCAYAVDALLLALKQPAFPQIARVAYWLGDIGDVKALSPLLAATHSPDAELRAAATQVLCRFPPDLRVLPALRLLVKDKNAGVRAAAINGIGRLGDATDVPLLLKAITDPEARVRAFAAQQLEQRADPRIPALLVQTLADSSSYVSWTAARTLIVRKDPTVVAAVRVLLKDLPEKQAEAAQAVIRELAVETEDIFARLVEYSSLPEHGNQRKTDLLNYFTHNRQCRDSVMAALAEGQPPALRLGALRAEQAAKDPRALPLILAAVQDDAHPEVSDAAISTLASARDQYYSEDEHLGMRMIQRRAHGWYSSRGPERPLLRAESVFADPRLVAPLIARAEKMDLVTPLVMDQGKPDARRDVIKLLGWTGDPFASDALARLLRAPDIGTRTAAAYALAAGDDPRAADPLLAALRASTGARLEEGLAMALSRMRDPQVYAALAEIARTHGQPKVRQSACLALGFTDDARTVEPLIGVLQHDNSAEVREFAAFALGQLADTRAVDPLITALQDKVEWARSAAACALGQIGDARAIPPLAQAATDPDLRFRRRVGTALALLGDSRGFSLLGDVVVGTDVQYAHFAVRTLGEFRDPRAVDALCPALDIPDGYFRFSEATVKGLGQIGGPRAAQVLLDLQEGGVSWTLPVLEALVATGDPRANETVLAKLANPNASSEYHVIAAAGLTGDPRMVAPLEAMPADNQDDVACALVRLGSERGLPRVLAQMQQYPGSYSEVCYAAARRPWSLAARGQIIQALAAQLGELSMTRVSAARALMAFGDPRGASVLLATYRTYPRGATHDDARAALEELDPVRDGEVLIGLIALLPEAHEAQREELIHLLSAIAARHPKTEALRAIVPQLIAELVNDDPRLREASARALGRFGDPRAIPSLLDHLADPAGRVREQAVIALGKIPDPKHQAIASLITVLRDDPSPRLRSAAAAALQTHTGQTFGNDAEQWAAWWKKQ
ncbi:MAG: HEAT repeat domain-containing protein [Armatimonadota bacterium]